MWNVVNQEMRKEGSVLIRDVVEYPVTLVSKCVKVLNLSFHISFGYTSVRWHCFFFQFVISLVVGGQMVKALACGPGGPGF